MYAEKSTKMKCLPYQLSSLTWGPGHFLNKQAIYCYCGRSGDWYWKMLQCRRCLQWFHEGCIGVLKYPLFAGDRFFVFVCSVCNSGKEFIQRLELSWEIIIHLSLFNMTLEHHIKYFDINEVIVPYIQRYWDRFITPNTIRNTPKEKMGSLILRTLDFHQNVFKNGKEIKKRFSWWGLRDREPPAPPALASLGGSVPITPELVLQALTKGNALKLGKNSEENIPHIPLKLDRKRKLCTDGVDEGQPRKKKKTSVGAVAMSNVPKAFAVTSNNQAYEGYSGHKDQYSSQAPPPSQTVTKSGDQQVTENNNSPIKIQLDSVIPPPNDFYGLNHPFKTILERNQELEHSKVRERLLIKLTKCNGLSTGELTPEFPVDSSPADSPQDVESDSTSVSQADSTASTETTQLTVAQRAQLKLLKIKRKKRGRPSKAEILALKQRMDAAIKMGLQENCVVQGTSSATNTPKPPEKRGRTKNVVDKSTLDSMSEKEVSLNQLRSSVNTYFGAANRLATGEGFRVLARRITPEGRVQYLVEWEGGIIG